MKIVSYVHAYVPHHNGGAETTLHDMNRALMEAGHESLVVIKETPLREYRPPYEVDGVKVIFAKDKHEIVRQIPGADLILTHLECSVRATVLGKKFRIPVAQLIHNDLDLTRNYVAHGPDFVVYNSEWIKEEFTKEFSHIPNIVVHPPTLSERYKTDRGKGVTLVNLFERKGADIFYALAERFPDVSFIGVKGGYGEQKIRHDIPNVEIMEYSPDIRRAYEKTKIILMPSVYESYGRVACEAAASGIPSIVADTRGLREALGDAGTYIDVRNVDAWEAALRASLTPRKYGALSKAALERSSVLDSRSRAELDRFVLFSEQFTQMYRRVK
jgi:glycosyltransferase involved in cell wall biosynthesis